MRGALLDHAPALAAEPALILGSGLRHDHHRALVARAMAPGDESAQDGLDVDPIGLAPLGAPIDPQRAGVDNEALDPGGDEHAVQPEAFVTGFVA